MSALTLVRPARVADLVGVQKRREASGGTRRLVLIGLGLPNQATGRAVGLQNSESAVEALLPDAVAAV